MNEKQNLDNTPDVVLIGAGIMSATFAVLLKELMPNLDIRIYERLNDVALESSAAWNNAGTGHSAFCELNYTPQKKDGSIDISKALKIASAFDVSRQFWAYLVEKGALESPDLFIHSIPHYSLVWGEADVRFLKNRHELLSKHALFSSMEFSEDYEQLSKWMPLAMQGRDPSQRVAATRMVAGTDVDYGALTQGLFKYLDGLEGVNLFLNHEVRDISRDENGQWNLTVKDLRTKKKIYLQSKFVFIGAGGASLPLLEKSDIAEAKGYGGFPVSGQWLRCKNTAVINAHFAKVYGKASVGSPPMSVPHLDTRIIHGEKALLFGPYAGFSTKFLKQGSYFDLAKSLEVANIYPMLAAGLHNLPLTKYLIQQARQSMDERMQALREFFPGAQSNDWELVIAGQRVQVIRKDEEEGGVLEFGTEIVRSGDGSLVALLGASPGASTSVAIMLDVLEMCFVDEMKSDHWQEILRSIVPCRGRELRENPIACRETRLRTAKILALAE